MLPISEHELKGHAEKLRQIFGLSFLPQRGERGVPFELDRAVVPSAIGPIVSYTLHASTSTESVLNDRLENDVCAIIMRKDAKRILCSFFEKWYAVERRKSTQFRFGKAGMKFFLSFGDGQDTISKQIFRLEWDNWQDDKPPNKAAYPHWQFDQWLTASDGLEADALKRQFQPAQDEVRLFAAAEPQSVAQEATLRPSLGWFTLLHFPAIAPWNTSPIKTLDDPHAPQCHRSIPETIGQLEGWIKSALLYLKSELDEYA